MPSEHNVKFAKFVNRIFDMNKAQVYILYILYDYKTTL